MAGPTKWMSALRERMEKKGTTGALREAAMKMGLLKGKGDTLSMKDLSRMEAHGSAMMKKRVMAAHNMMKAGK